MRNILTAEPMFPPSYYDIMIKVIVNGHVRKVGETVGRSQVATSCNQPVLLYQWPIALEVTLPPKTRPVALTDPMSEASHYNWKARYAGMMVSDLRQLKALEAENRRLKQLAAEQALDNLMLKELLSRNL